MITSDDEGTHDYGRSDLRAPIARSVSRAHYATSASACIARLERVYLSFQTTGGSWLPSSNGLNSRANTTFPPPFDQWRLPFHPWRCSPLTPTP